LIGIGLTSRYLGQRLVVDLLGGITQSLKKQHAPCGGDRRFGAGLATSCRAGRRAIFREQRWIVNVEDFAALNVDGARCDYPPIQSLIPI
jgi:hypothetical protein